MQNKKGFTLIESLLAVTIISTAVMGGMYYLVKKKETENIDEFIYDYKKIIQGFEQKILYDNHTNKEQWRNLVFDQDDFQEHIKHNLINKESKCAKDSNHPEMERSYINCFSPVNFHQFASNFEGEIDFYRDGEFKSYIVTFSPKNSKGLKKLKPLKSALKKVFVDTNFYSDFDYFVNGNIVSYTSCLKRAELCQLRMSFGKDIDYLEDEAYVYEEETDERFHYGHDFIYESDLEPTIPTEGTMETVEGVKEVMKSQGIEVNDKEALSIKEQVDKIKNDPNAIREMKQQLDMLCDQYDSDDYYFMKLYDKDNICYRYKTEGLQ